MKTRFHASRCLPSPRAEHGLPACPDYKKSLGLAGRAHDVANLVGNHILHGFPGRRKVGARVKLFGMFGKELPDGGGERKADVCIDIDLAYAHFRGLAQHFFRNAPCAADLAAIFVAQFDKFFGNARRAVQNKRIAGKLAGDFLKPRRLQVQGRCQT